MRSFNDNILTVNLFSKPLWCNNVIVDILLYIFKRTAVIVSSYVQTLMI
jgi:hypothetical protein